MSFDSHEYGTSSDRSMTVDLQLAGKVALVTAASKGLGRATAETLGGEGMKVAVASRDLAALKDVAATIDEGGGESLPLELDLSRSESIDAVVDRVLERWGRIDVLVANAPGPPAGPFGSISRQQWRDAIDMNVLSILDLTRAVLPAMKKQGGGRIIYITTIGVRTVQPNMVLSNATRLAISGVAKTLATELAQDNILINSVAPGPIATGRMEEVIEEAMERLGVDRDEEEKVWLSDVPMGRMGLPGDLASVVALLSSPRCSYTTGSVIPVDGGKDRGY
jgi:3-oxoacyl-[acyl-carrier protein] reductase